MTRLAFGKRWTGWGQAARSGYSKIAGFRLTRPVTWLRNRVEEERSGAHGASKHNKVEEWSGVDFAKKWRGEYAQESSCKVEFEGKTRTVKGKGRGQHWHGEWHGGLIGPAKDLRNRTKRGSKACSLSPFGSSGGGVGVCRGVNFT
ncbi:unnamed protein product [Calypogeia fissa]